MGWLTFILSGIGGFGLGCLLAHLFFLWEDSKE